MRDPDATLLVGERDVVRTLGRAIGEYPFLVSDLSSRWQAQGMMVPYTVIDDHQIRAERIQFVTEPSEWCDAQLHDAGTLTLSLLSEAIDAGFDLKDASAWNILFAGTHPMLCDHTSVVALSSKRWWAADQFSRHFLLPLLLASRRGLHAGAAFKLWRDGVPQPAARRMLGPSRYLTRYWPLLADASSPSSAEELTPQGGEDGGLAGRQTFRRRLIASLSWMNDGLAPSGAAAAEGPGWRGYVTNRDHYQADSIDRKREQIAAWLDLTRSRWVLDLGCNTGEFSRMALERGARVVAADYDHDALQSLYLQHADNRDIYPMLLNLDDMSGGRGWLGDEHPGAASRLRHRFDLVLMLALVHHLMISLAIPLAEVARLARTFTRDWLVVEWIDGVDPQVGMLCGQRGRNPADFHIDTQQQAFIDAGFRVEATLDLAPTRRRLALLRCA